jgi:hypothetical protein
MRAVPFSELRVRGEQRLVATGFADELLETAVLELADLQEPVRRLTRYAVDTVVAFPDPAALCPTERGFAHRLLVGCHPVAQLVVQRDMDEVLIAGFKL